VPLLRPPLTYLAFAASLATASAGCVDFNECGADGDVLLGRAGIALDLRESVVRTQETPIGNVVADGLYSLARTLCETTATPCPDIAFQNAGGLRQETACGERAEIPAGPLYQQDVEDLMPFENDLAVIAMTGRDVKRALERGVSALGQAGEASQAGFFLHLSGLQVDVDCAEPAQTLAPDQRRIDRAGARIISARLVSEGRDEEILDDVEYEVAVNSFIGSGNDGYLSFLLLDDAGVVLLTNGEPTRRLTEEQDLVRREDGVAASDRFAVSDWIRAHEAAELLVGRPPEGRINIAANCYGDAPDSEPAL